jgi:hypothetical protein
MINWKSNQDVTSLHGTIGREILSAIFRKEKKLGEYEPLHRLFLGRLGLEHEIPFDSRRAAPLSPDP